MKRLIEGKLTKSWVEHTALVDIILWNVANTRLCILFFEVDSHPIRMAKERKNSILKISADGGILTIILIF